MRLNRKALLLTAGVGTVIAFVTIFIHVFRLSHESGTTYAPYSTFRSDPLGTMALYNALTALNGTQVERYIQRFDEMPNGNDTTFVIAGAGLSPDPVPVLDAVEGFVVTGGRLVIAFFPIQNEDALDNLRDLLDEIDDVTEEDESRGEGSETDDEAPETIPVPADQPGTDAPPVEENSESNETKNLAEGEGEGEEADDGQRPDNTMDFGPAMQDISERWDFDYGFDEPGLGTVLERRNDTLAVQPTFEGRSGLYFIPNDEAWHVVYGKEQPEGQPGWAGIMERKIGSGSIVLCSDAFFLSNEALQEYRDPELLAWLFGGQPMILFSEAHLGTQQQDRLMTLVRRYRLHGVLFGFILVGALFVWHHAATLIPRREESERAAPTTMAERSHQDGLDNLLARFIPRGQLLDTCVREWSQQFHNDPKGATVKQMVEQKKLSAGLPSSEADLIAAYNDIAREIHPK